MRLNTGQLGHAETSLILQARIEKLNPQRILVRDLLVERCGVSVIDASDFVRRLDDERAGCLKELIEKAEMPRVAVHQFCVTLMNTDVEGA